MSSLRNWGGLLRFRFGFSSKRLSWRYFVWFVLRSVFAVRVVSCLCVCFDCVRVVVCVADSRILASLARGFHPFPSRTRSLSPAAATILGSQDPGKIARRQMYSIKKASLVGFWTKEAFLHWKHLAKRDFIVSHPVKIANTPFSLETTFYVE